MDGESCLKLSNPLEVSMLHAVNEEHVLRKETVITDGQKDGVHCNFLHLKR